MILRCILWTHGGERVPLQRFAGFPPTAEATGDIESMGLLAGQSVGLVTDIKPAAVMVANSWQERARSSSSGSVKEMLNSQA